MNDVMMACTLANLKCTLMLQRGTFLDYATYILWHTSRLASRWIGRLIKEHYLVLLFFLMLPIMFSRINVNPRSVIWSDAEGYYQYLPALFIIKDVHKLPPGSVWPYYNDKGEYVDKYTCGVAIFEFPFFLAAYTLSPIYGFDRMDYFNPLYCKSVAICGLLVTFLGLFFLRKVLLRMVSPAITFWVLISVLMGTNLFHYATREMSIAHVFNFFLFSFFIYLLPGWLKNPGRSNSLVLGAVLGWVILIRPTNSILAILLLGYDVYSLQALRARVHFLIYHARAVVWMIPGLSFFSFPSCCIGKK